MKVLSIRCFSVFVSTVCLLIIINTANTMIADEPASLEIGDYIEFGVYNGQPMLWQVVHKDAEGNPLLFSAEILSFKAFDGKETQEAQSATDYNTFREESGNNRWAVSNMREWLNSDQLVVDYSTALPNKDNVSGGHNSYEFEAGFLNGFSDIERLGILPTEVKTTLSFEDVKYKTGGSEVHQFTFGTPSEALNNYNSGYYETTLDRVFLLSIDEIANYLEGNSLSLARKPTIAAIENDDSGRFFMDQEASYWLRTPSATSAVASRTIITGGYVNYDNAFYSYVGVVPAFYLDGQITSLLSGEGTLVAPYLVSINGVEAEFKDRNLETAIRSAIGKPSGPIYVAELKRLTHLNASSKQIKDLSGIEVMTNLESLDLSYNNITDFKKLDQLSQLKSLEIQYNNIEEMDFLVDIIGLTTYVEPLKINLSGNDMDFYKEEIINIINLLGTFNIQVDFFEMGAVNLEVEQLIGTYLGTLPTTESISKEKEALNIALEDKLITAGTVTQQNSVNRYEADGLEVESLSKKVINLEKEINQQLKQNDVFLDRELTTAVIIELPSINPYDETEIIIPKYAVENLLTDQLILKFNDYSLVLDRRELMNDFTRALTITFKIKVEPAKKEQTVLVNQLSEAELKVDCGTFAQRIHDLIKGNILQNPEQLSMINEIAIQKKVVPTDLYHITLEKDGEEVKNLYGSFLIRIYLETGKNYSTLFRDQGGTENLGGAYDQQSKNYEALIYEEGVYYIGDQMMAINDVLDEEDAFKINYFLSKDILQLNETDQFMPDHNITRAEVAKAFVQLAHLYNQNASSHFVDVSRQHPLYDYIASSADRGIVSGYGDYTFRPDNDIIGSEFIKMIGAMLAYKKGYIYPDHPEDYVTFDNHNSLSIWLIDYLALCIREGFIDVDALSYYEEDKPLTRLEAVHLLYQLSQLL